MKSGRHLNTGLPIGPLRLRVHQIEPRPNVLLVPISLKAPHAVAISTLYMFLYS